MVTVSMQIQKSVISLTENAQGMNRTNRECANDAMSMNRTAAYVILIFNSISLDELN